MRFTGANPVTEIVPALGIFNNRPSAFWQTGVQEVRDSTTDKARPRLF